MSNFKPVVQASKQEIARVVKEKRYWKELADALGWKLYGWSFKSRVTYFDSRSGPAIELTGQQRDDIMAAIAKAKEVRNG